MVGSPCLTIRPFAIFGNTQEPQRGQDTHEVWPWCTVIGSCRCLLLRSPCLTIRPFAIFGNTQEPKRGQDTQEVWPWCTVIGSCRCLLLACSCLPWTLAIAMI